MPRRLGRTRGARRDPLTPSPGRRTLLSAVQTLLGLGATPVLPVNPAIQVTAGEQVLAVERSLPSREFQVNPTRKTALIAGWFFLATFITSIPAAFYFYEPVLKHADYIVGAGAGTRVAWGAVLEVLLAIANIGT